MHAINAAYEPLLFNNTNNNFYQALGEVTSEEAIAGGRYVVGIKSALCLHTAIGVHAPDLHGAGAQVVEVTPIPSGKELYFKWFNC